MTTHTKTTPQTWPDLLAIDPSLSAIDTLIDRLLPTLNLRNPWPAYELCRRQVTRRVGWDARHAPEALQTSAAYELAINHVIDRLGI